MKINIHSDSTTDEVEISIKCGPITPEIEKIISMLRMLEMQLTGHKDGETYIIDIAKVFYIDTADKKTFIYTDQDIYETNMRLYELEEQLSKAGFFRANKSCLINFRYITSLKSDLDRKIIVTLRNGEKLIVSRQYADYLKQKLEVK